jgi:hypothetical protein
MPPSQLCLEHQIPPDQSQLTRLMLLLPRTEGEGPATGSLAEKYASGVAALVSLHSSKRRRSRSCTSWAHCCQAEMVGSNPGLPPNKVTLLQRSPGRGQPRDV